MLTDFQVEAIPRNLQKYTQNSGGKGVATVRVYLTHKFKQSKSSCGIQLNCVILQPEKKVPLIP